MLGRNSRRRKDDIIVKNEKLEDLVEKVAKKKVGKV